MGSVRAAIKADLTTAKRAWYAVTDGAVPRDLLVLFGAIPVLLLGVEVVIQAGGLFAPIDRAAFRFPVTDDGLTQPRLLARAYLAGYAHDSLRPHLVNNLLLYLLTTVSLYAIGLRIDRRGTALYVVSLALIGGPLVAATGTLAHPTGTSTIGFSGSVATLVGALPVFLFVAAGQLGPSPVDPRWSAPPVFSVITAVAASGGIDARVVVGVGVATILMTGILLYVRGVRTVAHGLMPLFRVRHPFVLFGTFVVVSGSALLFFSTGPATNLTAHLACYSFGYLGALLAITHRGDRPKW